MAVGHCRGTSRCEAVPRFADLRLADPGKPFASPLLPEDHLMQASPTMHRRHWLQTTGCGFGWLAVQALAARQVIASGAADSLPGPHFPPRAKRIIFLFMQGGPSQVDTFDHKPALAEHDGQSIAFDDSRVLAKTGRRGDTHRVMKSPWQFRQYGQGGHWVSDLFPEMARCADDLCMIHSAHTEGVAHGPATLFLHTGATAAMRPSIGSWVHYGLGSENENLPGFVTLGPPLGNGGPRNFSNAFLPAIHQGTPIGRVDGHGDDLRLKNTDVPEQRLAATRRRLDFIQSMNQRRLDEQPHDTDLDAMVRSYELAWRLQNHAPEVFDLGQETAETMAEYGIGEKPTDAFGRRCLLARRLSEAGVRFSSRSAMGTTAPIRPGTSTATCPSTPTMPWPWTAPSRHCSTTSNVAGCWKTRSSGGAASLDAHPMPSPTGPAGITTRSASPPGWPALGCAAVITMVKPTNLAIAR